MPPVLEEKHVEEILLRFPPHEPAGLLHAALVCKRWHLLISDPAFRRRYREFHRTAPMLAFFTNGVADDPDRSRHVSHFVPEQRAPKFWRSRVSRTERVLDARHGRVLTQRVEEEDARHARVRNPFQRGAAAADALRNQFLYPSIGAPVEGARELFVTVPVSKEKRREVPIPSQLRILAAAVLCSDTTGACNHLDCDRGHFLVVLVAASQFANTFVFTYSSETATWSGPISAQRTVGVARLMPSAYVGNVLYFGFRHLKSILEYDLQSGQISWIELPSMCCIYQPNVLTTTEPGVLGLATIRGTKLYVWSWKDAPQVDDAGWTEPRVIELRRGLTLADALAFQQPYVVGSADGIGVIFFWANGVIRVMDIKTCKGSKMGKGRNVYTLIPYMSFCTPASGADCTREGPSAGGSSA